MLGRPPKTNLDAIKSTIVFHWNREATAQIIVNRGSARSSKSFSIMQLLIEWFFTVSKVRILVLRKTQPSLRLSCIPDFNRIIDMYKVRHLIRENKTSNDVFSSTGLLHFGGLDNPEKIRSSEWNVIFMEEATEFTFDDFINLKLRLSAPAPSNFRNRMFLGFNPTDEFSYIKKKIIDGNSEDFKEIHSTYKYNPFLTDDYIRTIEALETQDLNHYRIFTLGEWGKLENIIYSNWSTIPFMYDNGNKIYGLDFGYVNPTVLLEINVDGKEICVNEKLYQTGLTNTSLIEQLNILIPDYERGACPIYADAAEPQRIQEINQAGFWCMPADKSVKAGIGYLKGCKLRITEQSDHILKEIRSYSFRKDKQDNVIEEPVKFQDHCMDALRYGVYTYHAEGRDMDSSFFKVM